MCMRRREGGLLSTRERERERERERKKKRKREKYTTPYHDREHNTKRSRTHTPNTYISKALH